MTLILDDDQGLSMSPAAIYHNEDFLRALSGSDKVLFYNRARHLSHLRGVSSETLELASERRQNLSSVMKLVHEGLVIARSDGSP